ncbi:TolC family protein, partial [Odoribacter sp. OttesenSCG-928-G04]|nr:TolC family protein [Odoribacter sp. OttesenSCG-928-G04]
PGDTIKMSLENCLDYAFQNNYSRQSIKLNETAKEDLYDQSKMERLPSLSASLSENLSHTKGNSASWDGSYGLNANMTLYQGGSINHTIRQNLLKSKQSEYQTAQYDNELTIQILQAFLTALGNEELLKYQQAVLVTSEEQVKQGKDLFRVGQILESDYLLLEAQWATDQNNVLETTINRDNSLLSLKSLLSMNPQQPIQVIYPDTTTIQALLLVPNEEETLKRALETMPDILISNYNVEIAETGLKIVQSSYYPSLNFNGSIGTGHAKNFSNYGDQLADRRNEKVGLTLSIPIFNKNKTKSNVTQSRIALEQAELDQKQTELNIRQTVIQEYRNVISASSKYRTSEIKQGAYFKSFEAYRSQFNAGSITTVDLLQQQNNYINAINEYIQNKYGFMLKRKILDVYMGENITM